MIGQPDNQRQTHLFKLNLIEQLDPTKPLYILAQKLPWSAIENRFKNLYSNTGQPAHPIRLMTGLLLLQRIFNLSDERTIELWQENPYFQFFCGKNAFQWTQPCAASDLVHFRKRIGQQGIDFLFALSVQLHQHKINKAQQVIVDSTVQEKHITEMDPKFRTKSLRRVTSQKPEVTQRWTPLTGQFFALAKSGLKQNTLHWSSFKQLESLLLSSCGKELASFPQLPLICKRWTPLFGQDSSRA